MDKSSSQYHMATSDGEATFSGRKAAVDARHAAAGAASSWSRFARTGSKDANGVRKMTVKKGRAAFSGTDGRTKGVTYGAY
jgi:hypothetical protein